jgi:hypothetical protein
MLAPSSGAPAPFGPLDEVTLASAAVRSALSASPQLRKAVSVALATAFDEDVVWFPATVEEVVQPVTASDRQIRSAALARLHCGVMAL